MKQKEINNKIEMVIRCLMAHPDNEPYSEFADRIDDLIDVNQAITVTRCCKSDSEQLKSEIDTEFEKFVEANTNEQKIAPMYWHNDRCFWSRDDLYKWWLENKDTF